MAAPTFTDGEILKAADLNTVTARTFSALQAANNLSDIANAATARGNLGAGTVNSVALSVPAEFTVAGSPVTNSGTLAVSRTTQAANLVQAGPASGAAATPTFRALLTPDLPPVGNSMAFRAGRFYIANGITSGGTSATIPSGSLIAGAPIFVPNAVTLQTLSCIIAGTVSGTAHVRMALYTDAGGYPGAPVAGADSGDLSTTAAAVMTSGTLGAALAPGWYWPVWESSGLAGGTVWAVNGGRPTINAQLGALSVNTIVGSGWLSLLATHTYGAALPNPWATASETSTYEPPIVALGF